MIWAHNKQIGGITTRSNKDNHQNDNYAELKSSG